MAPFPSPCPSPARGEGTLGDNSDFTGQHGSAAGTGGGAASGSAGCWARCALPNLRNHPELPNTTMMRFLHFILVVLLFVLSVAAAHAALLPPRPPAGVGVLAVGPGPGAAENGILIYREPGVGRIAEVSGADLPGLAGTAAQPLVAVRARRGAWCRIAYDDAGREGWIEKRRSWRYLSWAEFLPGRRVKILPGMKKANYLLRAEPGGAARELDTLSRDQVVAVLEVDGDWARLKVPAGWLRWRDGDERLTIGVSEETTEKR